MTRLSVDCCQVRPLLETLCLMLQNTTSLGWSWDFGSALPWVDNKPKSRSLKGIPGVFVALWVLCQCLLAIRNFSSGVQKLCWLMIFFRGVFPTQRLGAQSIDREIHCCGLMQVFLGSGSHVTIVRFLKPPWKKQEHHFWMEIALRSLLAE